MLSRSEQEMGMDAGQRDISSTSSMLRSGGHAVAGTPWGQGGDVPG